MNTLLSKLNVGVLRFEELKKLLIDPDILANINRFVELKKEYNELEKIVLIRNRYKVALDRLSEAQTILFEESDSVLQDLAKEEVEQVSELILILEQEIKLLLMPTNLQDQKNAIVEIRSGTGGNEAALFAGDLFRMYVKYCESKKWETCLTSSSESPLGGFKEIVFTVTGENVYGNLKYEAGVHRVQRIPITETQGKIHTSAATVAIFPAVEEIEIELKESDIKMDIFCSSGPGGQSVNTTYSAIRLTHLPTGITVQCQDERSQLKNKEKALVELRSRIYQMEHQRSLDKIAVKRKSMVSSGDRSVKIRTYNYPQKRITDHRINYTLYNLSSFLDGDIQKMIDQLMVTENVERLKDGTI